MRLMGKKQIGQLQPSELVVALFIANLASASMANIGVPLINGLIPIMTLFVIEKLLSFIALKSERGRGLICGTPSIVINKGVIVQKELQSLYFNINDLLELLRIKNFFDIQDVEYAILETSGDLSVIPKGAVKPLTPKDMNLNAQSDVLPITLIIDGRTNSQNLRISGLDENWLQNELVKNKISSVRDVFFAYVTPDLTTGDTRYQKFNFQLKQK